jgi:hypothetical protein
MYWEWGKLSFVETQDFASLRGTIKKKIVVLSIAKDLFCF